MIADARVSGVSSRFRRSAQAIGAILLLAPLVATGPGPLRAADPEPLRSELITAEGGQPFDDFRRDAVLTGLRVTVDKFGRWSVIDSMQPIYRLPSGDVVRGAIHGADHGLELVSEAKPGYALGQLVVSRGGRIDGLRCVFMRLKEGKLDPSNRYEGRWLGAFSDTKLIELPSGGKIAIGVQGRAADEIHGVGLLLAPDLAAAPGAPSK